MSTAKLGIEVSGARAGVADLEALRASLKAIDAEASRLSVQMAAWKKAWDDPLNAKQWSRNTKLAVEGAKALGNVLASQASALASAVTAPAKTSYDEALRKAYLWRDENQRVATSLGKDYGETQRQIMGTAKQLGLMPGRVRDYSQSVRELTGDWQGAASGIEGYQNWALKTGQSLEALIPISAELANSFGVKSTEDVNKFFGTLDAQAKKSKASVELTAKAFAGMAGMLSATTSAKPETLTAITAEFMGKAPTPQLGQQAMAETMGLLTAHPDVIEGRMRAAGKLGKDERLRDKTGRFRGEKLLDVMEFLQTDIPKIYQTKSKEEAVARLARTGEMSATGAAALLGFDVKAAREAAGMRATAPPLAKQSLLNEAGKRTSADVAKETKDIEFGSKFLGAQDVAVEMGGGAAGVLLGSAGQLFDQGGKTFWNAVQIFAKAAGPGVAGSAGSAAGAAAGAATGTATTAATTGVASRVIGALGVPGMAAAALTMEGDIPARYRAPATATQTQQAIAQRLTMERAHLADVRKGGASGWVAETFFGGGEKETQARIAKLEAEAKGSGATEAASASAIGKAVADSISRVTLQTQEAGVEQPIGQGQQL